MESETNLEAVPELMDKLDKIELTGSRGSEQKIMDRMEKLGLGSDKLSPFISQEKSEMKETNKTNKTNKAKTILESEPELKGIDRLDKLGLASTVTHETNINPELSSKSELKYNNNQNNDNQYIMQADIILTKRENFEKILDAILNVPVPS